MSEGEEEERRGEDASSRERGVWSGGEDVVWLGDQWRPRGDPPLACRRV